MTYPATRKPPRESRFCRNGHERAVFGMHQFPNGRRICKRCWNAKLARTRAPRRKAEQIEPEYEVLDETQVPAVDTHVSRNYWDSIMRTLDLLGPRQWLHVLLPPNYRLANGSIQYAAKRAGVVVIHRWTTGGLYLKRVRRRSTPKELTDISGLK